MSDSNGVASVLLLEDDWDHRAVFRKFLQHRGWVVREAADADTARALLAREPADVIVLDLGGTNGWALLQDLGPREDRPRMLCLTGDARPESRERAVGLGADAYLVKPVLLRTLGHALEQLAGLPARAGQQSAEAGEAARPNTDAPAARHAWAGRGWTRPAWAGPEDPDRHRPVVLLLEDDEDARTIYRDMLDFAGYDVMAARNGEEGLRYAETRTPDVVVTDLHMPGMNGVEVARTLREEATGCAAIIAVTADSLGVDVGKQLIDERPLFDQVLVKPVSPGDLVRTVRAYVSPEENPPS